MPRTPSIERAASPAWLLLVPLLVLGLVWFMSGRMGSPRVPASKAPPRRTPANRGAPALPAPKSPPPSAALPPTFAPPSIAPGYWTTPRRGAAYEPYFLAATAKYGLPRGLLSRIAARESNYKPDAISSAGAIGLMQIVPRFHPGVNAKDPIASIDYAAKFLRQLFTQFQSWTLAVAAYNAGPGNVKKYGGVPPFAETRAYVAAILPDIGVVQPEPGVLYA